MGPTGAPAFLEATVPGREDFGVARLQCIVDDHARTGIERDAAGVKPEALHVRSPTHTDEDLIDGDLPARLS